jgi:hypothetical protein
VIIVHVRRRQLTVCTGDSSPDNADLGSVDGLLRLVYVGDALEGGVAYVSTILLDLRACVAVRVGVLMVIA